MDPTDRKQEKKVVTRQLNSSSPPLVENKMQDLPSFLRGKRSLYFSSLDTYQTRDIAYHFPGCEKQDTNKGYLRVKTGVASSPYSFSEGGN